MKFQGQIRKMSAQFGEPIQYYLNLSHDLLHMNALFGRSITFTHMGYQCVNCGSDEPIFQMGFCKKCFFESPYASETILKPELSKAHLGIEERDLEVEQQIQLQPHIVYLAYTGDVKVGVTREAQVPTRWIDQGATQALPIARTENRYEAGVIEVALKNHLSDKTNWRKMLNDETNSSVDLLQVRDEVAHYIPSESQKFIIHEDKINLHFPYQAPDKITSVNLSKQPEIKGILKGIKGQYLAFETGQVMNMRSHEGYVVALDII
ncbi:DUF2797 domain-containing protein [Riemerella columbina]|uniref:DUF2797 domain-containing protein n=1 Tax=Riemerella columbina TaxID=103810 RepID=UPI0003805D73|nr:DUF2797 domain-containing protein [Riemerella columbina]